MYAIIETGGKQFKVAEGDVLKVELLHAEAGETVEINKVLMVNNCLLYTSGDRPSAGNRPQGAAFG